MINIFKVLNGRTSYWREETDRNDTSAVRDYIVRRISAVCDKLNAEDMEAVEYMMMLYYRVLEDRKISPETRSLVSMLEKMESDLRYSVEIFAERAKFCLHFLEIDTLLHALKKSSQEYEQNILGYIRWMQSAYFQDADNKKDNGVGMKPMEIKYYLDQYIIGQETAKKVISQAVYGHLKRIRHPEVRFAPDIVLLIGPSGCGKTEIMRRIRDITDLPMVFTDVSNLGASQYRGRHKEDILLDLYAQAGGNKSLAEKGIIFMDEFDKILLPAISERGVNIHDDVQSQLLTMLEGSDVELKVERQNLLLNTSRILFVLAGAFQGIEECIKADQKKRLNIAGNMGYVATLEKDMNLEFVRENISHEVLMEYGMKRELAGRLSSITVLEKLTKDDILRILTEAKDNLIERYKREIELSCGAELCFTDDALSAIAEKTLKDKTGARALHSIVSGIMRPILYAAPDRQGIKSIIIDEEVVNKGAEALYIGMNSRMVEKGRKEYADD